MAPIIAIVGGFLGAGKTTALLAAAQHLQARGLRVGLITNDQSGDLVDAALVKSFGFSGEAVEGGCFCCRLDDMIGATDRLLAALQPDILLAEPVGSCTDLVATVVRPLERRYGQQLQVAPFSVLVDPLTLHDRLPGSTIFPLHVTYLFERQIAEADLLVLSRVDLLDEREREHAMETLQQLRPDAPVHLISSLRGDGLDAWLDAILLPGAQPRAALDLDYDRYADAEAALGWLNAGLMLSAATPFSLDSWVATTLENVSKRLQVIDAPIAHLKIQAEASDGVSKASLVHGSGVTFDRTHPALVRSGHALVNARAVCKPDQLEQHLRAALAQTEETLGVSAMITGIQSFAPARPQPQERIPA